MDIRSSIIMLNRFVAITIHTNRDYNHKREIPFREWLKFKRYEFYFLPRAYWHKWPKVLSERWERKWQAKAKRGAE